MKSLFLFASFATASHLAQLSGAWVDNLPDTKLFEESLCTHDAVFEYLEDCSSRGVDSVEPLVRLRLAVRLSVCEFRAAKVEYPESCKFLNSHDTYNQCVQAFRANSQLWTTYSGNWRKLRSMCHEEAAPFIKTQILNLYFNVTELFSQFFQSASESYADSEKFSQAAASKLNTTLQAILDMQTRVEVFEHTLQVLLEKMELMIETSQESWDTAQSRAERFFDSFDSTSTEVMDTVQEMSESTKKQVELWVDMEESISVKQTSLLNDHIRQMGELSSKFQLELDSTLGFALSKSQQVALVLESFSMDIAGTLGMMESHVGLVANNYMSQARDEFHRLEIAIEQAALSAQRQMTDVVEKNLQSLLLMLQGLELQIASLQDVVTNVQALGFTSLFPFIQRLVGNLKILALLALVVVLAVCLRSIQKYTAYFFLGLSVAMVLRVCADYM